MAKDYEDVLDFNIIFFNDVIGRFEILVEVCRLIKLKVGIDI